MWEPNRRTASPSHERVSCADYQKNASRSRRSQLSTLCAGEAQRHSTRSIPDARVLESNRVDEDTVQLSTRGTCTVQEHTQGVLAGKNLSCPERRDEEADRYARSDRVKPAPFFLTAKRVQTRPEEGLVPVQERHEGTAVLAPNAKQRQAQPGH